MGEIIHLNEEEVKSQLSEMVRETVEKTLNLHEVFGFTTPQVIYKWQRGTALPTVDNLVTLAAVFGVRIEDILIFQRNGRQNRITA